MSFLKNELLQDIEKQKQKIEDLEIAELNRYSPLDEARDGLRCMFVELKKMESTGTGGHQK